MNHILTWICGMELLAYKGYREASYAFGADQKFSAFLSRLSDEEAWHYYLIGSAMHRMRDADRSIEPEIRVDADTRNEIEAPLRELIDKIIRRSVTKADVVDCIIKTEFRELNSIFVYAIKRLRDDSPMFQHVAATIESHKEKIIRFLDDLPDELTASEHIWKLPKIWDKRILLVIEASTLEELLSNILENLAQVHIAATDREGLDQIAKGFFNVVISDTQLTSMTGAEFYREAVDLNPKIARQFLFLTDDNSRNANAFLTEHLVPYLEKPFNINRLSRTVREIIDKTL